MGLNCCRKIQTSSNKYLEKTDGIFVVYDITDKEYFDKLSRYIKDIDLYAKKNVEKNINRK